MRQAKEILKPAEVQTAYLAADARRRAGRLDQGPLAGGRTGPVGLHRCAALGEGRLLNSLEATTHHGAIDLLREVAPKTMVHTARRFVDNGRVVCPAGIAAGIHMSLHVVGRLLGQEVAEKTARQME